MAFGRPFVCALPGVEVLQLAAELDSLGGGDVALARAHATALIPQEAPPGRELVLGGEPYQVEALGASQAGAHISRLTKALQSWLFRGLSATVLLVQTEHAVVPASLLNPVAVAALSAGWRVGLSWQLSDGSQVWAAASGIAGRLGSSARSRPDSGAGTPRAARGPAVVSPANVGELEALLKLSAEPSLASTSRGGGGGVAAGAGVRRWVVTLHLHHGPSGATAALNVVVPPPEEVGTLLKMLNELSAGLHKQHCTGEHPLIGSTLSLFNHVAAPLLAGPVRLHVLAGVDPAQPEASQKLTAAMEQVPAIQVVCARSTGVSTTSLGWMPYKDFLRQQQEAEEQRRQAQLAAVAAAAAVARRQQAAQQVRPGSALRRASNSSRLGRAPQQQELTELQEGEQRGKGQEWGGEVEGPSSAQPSQPGANGREGDELLQARPAGEEGQEVSLGMRQASLRLGQATAEAPGEGSSSMGEPHSRQAQQQQPLQQQHYARAQLQEAEPASYAQQALQRNGSKAGPARRPAAAQSCGAAGPGGGGSSEAGSPRGSEQGTWALGVEGPGVAGLEALAGLLEGEPWAVGDSGAGAPVLQPPEAQEAALGRLRQQFADIYSQTLAEPDASLPSSLWGSSAPSPRADCVSDLRRSHDVFSSIAGGSQWSPGSVQCAGLPGRWSAVPSGHGRQQGSSQPPTPLHRTGSLHGIAAAAAAAPTSLPASSQNSPGRQDQEPGRTDDHVSAQMAHLRLRTVMAQQEEELRERQRWGSLHSQGNSPHYGPATAAARAGEQAQPLEPPEEECSSGGAGGLGQAAGGVMSGAAQCYSDEELLYEHLQRQLQVYTAEAEHEEGQHRQWLYAATVQPQQHSSQDEEQQWQQQQQGEEEGVGSYAQGWRQGRGLAQPARAHREEPAAPEEDDAPGRPEGGEPSWLAWDEGGSWAQLEDAALTLGAITRQTSSFAARPSSTAATRSIGPAGVAAAAATAARVQPPAVPAAVEEADGEGEGEEAGSGREGSSADAAAEAGTKRGASTLDDCFSSTAELLGSWQGRGSSGEASPPSQLSRLQQQGRPRRPVGAGVMKGQPRHRPAEAPEASSSDGRVLCGSPSTDYAKAQPPKGCLATSSPAFANVASQERRPPHSAASSSHPSSRSGTELHDRSRGAAPASLPSLAPSGAQPSLEGSCARLAAEQRLPQPREKQQQQQQQPGSAAEQTAWQQQHTPLQQPPLTVDASNFNALLAALQRERQVSASLQYDLQALQQVSAERVLTLEVELATLEQRLAAAQARCRAWEQNSPFSELFDSYEAEVARLEAQGRQLREEGSALARQLAGMELAVALGPPGSLPPDAAVVARELRKRLQHFQGAAQRLEGEKEGLLAELQAMKRRDRLAELYRRQAEDLMRRNQELQRQLAAKAQQLEAQCLGAARSGARADEMEEQLAQAEAQAQGALAENGDLKDTVDSLRKQLRVLRATLSRDRVMQHMNSSSSAGVKMLSGMA